MESGRPWQVDQRSRIPAALPTHNAQVRTTLDLICIESTSVQIGGSARGYQGLSARLAISTMDEQADGPGRLFMHVQCRA
jgi:hypothetical protein